MEAWGVVVVRGEAVERARRRGRVVRKVWRGDIFGFGWVC